MTTASTASTLINPLKFLQLVLVFCSSSVQKNSSSKESKTVNVDKDKKKQMTTVQSVSLSVLTSITFFLRNLKY